MKNVIYVLTSIFTLTFIGCTSSFTISTDYDTDIDFKSYSTFDFLPLSKEGKKWVNDIDQKRLETAITEALALRGITYTPGKKSTTMIGIHVVIKNKMDVTAYSDYYGGMGYYGRGFGYGYPNGAGVNVSTNVYKVGTLVIDQYDTESKKLVWEGIIQGQVNVDPSHRAKNISKNISKLYAKYPLESKE